MLQAYLLFKTRPMVAILIAALVMWSLGLPNWIGLAEAANVANFSDTLSNSKPGEDSSHTIVFTTPTGIAASTTVQIIFDPETDAFDLSSLIATDVTATSTAGAMSRVANQVACTGAAREFYVTIQDGSPDYVQINMCPTDSIPAAATVTVTIGSVNFIANPGTQDSYVVRLAGTWGDSGDTRVAIVDEVTVSAEVQTIFDFTVVGLDTTDTFTSETIAGTTTATSIPFGIISPNNEYFLAQELRVDTNALNGFTVTVETDQTLTAGNGADINTFIDGSDEASAANWQAPASTFGNTDTYGHWGITSDDDDTGLGNEDFTTGGPNYVGNFVANPVAVFFHDTASNYTIDQVAGESFARVGYKVEIGNLQEAGNDYTAVVMYIATPTF